MCIGIPMRVIMELMRHSDVRLSSNTYTDATCLPLFAEVEKLNPFLPSPIASPKVGKSGQNQGTLVQSVSLDAITEIIISQRENPLLADSVQLWDEVKMAEREGFEPPGPCGPPHFECGAIDHSATSP